MRMHDDSGRQMSHVFLRQVNRSIYLNDTLSEQSFFVEMEVKDPNGALVCDIAMSYEQFVRTLLFNGDVPVTLLKYRNIDGKLSEEKVPIPDSSRDSLIKDLDETIGGVANRIIDMRKDLYEILNSTKTVSKKKIEDLLEQIKVIESHYNSNIPYVTQEAVKKVSKIQDNAKSQLAIAMNQMIGSDSFKPEHFTRLIEGESIMALPDYTAEPVDDDYKLKDREEKNIDEMTNMELGDHISKYLKAVEVTEQKVFENKSDKEKESKTKMYGAHASGDNKGVYITYISYQGGHKIDTEKARRYLKFLKTIKTYGEFKSDYWF